MTKLRSRSYSAYVVEFTSWEGRFTGDAYHTFRPALLPGGLWETSNVQALAVGFELHLNTDPNTNELFEEKFRCRCRCRVAYRWRSWRHLKRWMDRGGDFKMLGRGLVFRVDRNSAKLIRAGRMVVERTY